MAGSPAVSEFTHLKLLNALGQIKNFNCFALICNKISNSNACESESFDDAFLTRFRFPAYVIDKSKTNQREKCPCCSENLTGIFGETSIGNTEVWHGPVDAIITGSSLVKFGSLSLDEGSELSPSHSNPGDSEVKKDFHEKDTHQILSQTITFSFLQNLMHPGEIPLYPNIVIRQKAIQLHFYDSVNDILIESYEENYLMMMTLTG
ncbi:uncharacterized protein LOC132726430 [Ruditapes philippinarum]|uniref:uncharacterized protein LOC132726430 n=1 Tax=Ruditapes philippinarum TaxID=129788 RepID=UPI00295BCDB8|nr:uncharacterized protein LOC132726430 [Ruditapes philippinarum]